MFAQSKSNSSISTRFNILVYKSLVYWRCVECRSRNTIRAMLYCDAMRNAMRSRETERGENKQQILHKPIKGHYDCIMRIEYRAVLWDLCKSFVYFELSFHAVPLIWFATFHTFSTQQKKRRRSAIAFSIAIWKIMQFVPFFMRCSHSCDVQ